ncbi:tRNA (adenosine(37)-N6)-threonylcarbamoyltransferase complex ATPase subunit type 1 TsaE [Microlunatus sp. Gsoil 973]|uniref:tRNA (adenosine(37)-N6)-threonylcarbamoyltransferase complex ATPase subunit type 1 TsaE n=1 Tax=Microlunatus sp. Gsoil 973 TaxID=2672569 RepID=UPI0012B4F73D|nr:tRNA (adenosine(37)-N6)-threonylcarbamoyltransferase complex ATPase subunit type 1 TsaE [Microlunatus sp. Gsoil 973]QGN35121.1 tRNA (adenosine(37)-N6)-threonylcarbamoyltransferase complex ATPase subunit type 1 TsaE [Microlunatus sp. Gsoil 973]
MTDQHSSDEPFPSYHRATAEHAAGMVEVIHAAFGARPPLDPPSTADAETADSVAAALAHGSGVYATVAGRPAGAIIIERAHDQGDGRTGVLRRVSVHPDFQRHGIASAMVIEAEVLAAELGCNRLELFAREEFPELITYWQHRGFGIDRQAPHGVILARPLPVRIVVPTADDMTDLGVALAGLLRGGDVIIATGDLGAGKTTLTQGIGHGLGAAGPIISPTFVLSRIHHSVDDRPDLVHVDAYRLSGPDELEDLDLEETLDRSVTVVEWGENVAEGLSPERLEITVLRSADPEDETRTVLITAVGERWVGVDLDSVAGLEPVGEK